MHWKAYRGGGTERRGGLIDCCGRQRKNGRGVGVWVGGGGSEWSHGKLLHSWRTDLQADGEENLPPPTAWRKKPLGSCWHEVLMPPRCPPSHHTHTKPPTGFVRYCYSSISIASELGVGRWCIGSCYGPLPHNTWMS